MRNTRKILIALLIVLTLMVSMATLFVSAAAPEKLYLTPNANWKKDNARFAAYFFGNGETWVSMTDPDGDGIYEVDVPAGYPNVIFCRMNPSAAANNWNNKWNQTADLTVPTDGPNHYTVAEGTWDSGGGNWSTFGSTCTHTNLSEAATCTTAQTCLDCGDPVVSALGHSFDSTHLCTRCNEQATFTVAGSGAHLGTEWDTGNTANDMTYDAETATYTKVYTNVADGSYEFKVVRDHGWGTAYPSGNKAYTVATSGSTVTITLKGTAVNVVVEAPHVHSYFYPCDPVCQECYEISNPDAKHEVVHVEAVAATCYENGNVEYWYCSYCGTAWTDEAQTQLTNMMSVVTPMGHAPATHVEAVAPTCYENGNIEYWYCEACGQAWLDADCTLNTNLMSVVLPMAHGEAKHVEAKAATCLENGNIEYWLCEACGQAWLDADCTLNTNVKSVVLPAAGHDFVDGKCSVCEAADPDYVNPDTPVANDKLINFSEWEPFAKETYADGDTVKYNDIFTFIYSKNSRVDESSKTWDDFSGTLRFSFGGKTPTGSVPSKNALQITVDGAHTLKIWYVAGGDGRYFALMDSNGVVLSETTKDTIKNGQDYAELSIPAAGVYYFGVPGDNNYIFQLELVANTEPSCDHVWVDATCDNPKYCSVCGVEDGDYAHTILHVEAVAPTCYENGNVEYWYCSECGATWTDEARTQVSNQLSVVLPMAHAPATHVEAKAATCVAEGNIEYWLCEACGQAWLDADCTLNTNVKSVVLPMVDHTYFYNLCLVCYAANPNFKDNYVFVGDNKLVCNEYHLVDTEGHGFPYQFTFLTITEAGTYVFTHDKTLNVTVFTIPVTEDNAGDFETGGPGWNQYDIDGTVTLEPGVYYIGFVYGLGQGEYDLKIEKQIPHEHNFVEGKCECGEEDPNYVPPVDEEPEDKPEEKPEDKPETPDEQPEQPEEPAPKLNFFQKIVKAIGDFFKSIGNFFKNLFGGKKN